MSKVREVVEWQFGQITQQFPCLDFERSMKMLSEPVGKCCKVGAFPCNLQCSLCSNQTAEHFNIFTC